MQHSFLLARLPHLLASAARAASPPSRVEELEAQLSASCAALSAERALRATCSARASAAERDAAAQRDLAEDAARGRALAEEQLEVALWRLSEGAGAGSRAEAAEAELTAARAAMARERERVRADLEERTARFAAVEAALGDARETYVEATGAFGLQRARLAATVAELRAERDAFADRLREAEDAREPRDGGEGSSSSVSSASSSSSVVARRAEELEAALGSEPRETQMLRRKVASLAAFAKAKEGEAKRLRAEMTSIHARMRRMVAVSMPKGTEEGGEDEDTRRLAKIREKARAGEKAREEEKKAGVEYAKRAARRRLVDNKNIPRPWLNR